MGNVSFIDGHIDEPNKISDNEIIKGYCERKLCPPAQEIINRQKAEIERLQSGVIETHNAIAEMIKQAKSEAVKEFAERFMEKANKTTIIYVADTTIQEQETGWYQISIEDFNNLLKEMVGDTE